MCACFKRRIVLLLSITCIFHFIYDIGYDFSSLFLCSLNNFINILNSLYNIFSRTYTQYSVVVQAFNKLGTGPLSEEVQQYTAEGIPEQPPQDTTCTTLTSQTIRVSWVSPPLTAANGVIKGYKVVYGPSESWYGKWR